VSKGRETRPHGVSELTMYVSPHPPSASCLPSKKLHARRTEAELACVSPARARDSSAKLVASSRMLRDGSVAEGSSVDMRDRATDDAQVKQIPQEPNQDPSARWEAWMYLMASLMVVLR
jgi:hypothetical protein